MASREEALRLFPMGTTVGREFADSEGHSKVFKATVFDYSDPYWRVEYPDGDWEELTKRCLLYTSPSPRDRTRPRMPSSA